MITITLPEWFVWSVHIFAWFMAGMALSKVWIAWRTSQEVLHYLKEKEKP